MIIDLRRIEPRQDRGRKEGGEEIGTRVREFVQDQPTAQCFGENGHEAGSCRGFEHDIFRGDPSRRQSRKAKRDRCAKLLKILAVLRAAGLGGHQGRDFRELREAGVHADGLAEQRRAILAQEEDGGHLTGLVSGFPVPDAGGVGGPEGGFHCRAQDRGIDPRAALEMGKQKPRRSQEGRGRRNRCSGTRRRGKAVHVGGPRESGRKKGRDSALSPARIRPVAAPLSLSQAPQGRSAPTSRWGASGHPKRRPASVKVQSLARRLSSTASSEVR